MGIDGSPKSLPLGWPWRWSPSRLHRTGFWIAFSLIIVLLYGGVRVHEKRAWARIPAGRYALGQRELMTTHERQWVEVEAFRMQRTEVTVGQFVRFLNQVRPEVEFVSPQIEFERGRYRARVDRRQPVAYVDFEQARAYAAWLDGRRRRRVRLPTADEWEVAARGTTPGIPYPWGWADPEGRAVFAMDATQEVAQFAPNGFGLYDLAGNVAEWVDPADAEMAMADAAFAMGGSWAERDPAWLWIARRPTFPRTYRDADVGFRLVKEH